MQQQRRSQRGKHKQLSAAAIAHQLLEGVPLSDICLPLFVGFVHCLEYQGQVCGVSWKHPPDPAWMMHLRGEVAEMNPSAEPEAAGQVPWLVGRVKQQRGRKHWGQNLTHSAADALSSFTGCERSLTPMTDSHRC